MEITITKTIKPISLGPSILKTNKSADKNKTKTVIFRENCVDFIYVENWKKYNFFVDDEKSSVCSCNLL